MADQLPQPTTTSHPTDQPPTTNISHCYPTKKKKKTLKQTLQSKPNQPKSTNSINPNLNPIIIINNNGTTTFAATTPTATTGTNPHPPTPPYKIKKKKKKTTTRKIVAAITTRKTIEPTTHPPTHPQHQKNCYGHNPFTDLPILHHRFRRFRTHSPISHHRFR